MKTILLTLLFANSIPDGSILIVENGNRMVENQTASSFTHVAIIFNINNEPFVYEANKPRIKKISLKTYIQDINKLNRKKRRQRKLWLMKPKRPYNKVQKIRMLYYLRRQLGRKYSICSYITKKPKKGIHCGELTFRTLLKAGLNLVGNPCVQDPADVVYKSSKYYHPRIRIIHFSKIQLKSNTTSTNCSDNSIWLCIEKAMCSMFKCSRKICVGES